MQKHLETPRAVVAGGCSPGRGPGAGGFTLIEMLIVVILLAILAAVVIPMFLNFSGDARIASLMVNLQTIRRQMNLYRVDHRDQWPGGEDEEAGFVAQMTRYSNTEGETSATKSEQYPHGPYLSAIPVNPISGSNAIVFVTYTRFIAPKVDGGWWYNPETGEFRPYLNNDHALPDGRLLNQL